MVKNLSRVLALTMGFMFVCNHSLAEKKTFQVVTQSGYEMADSLGYQEENVRIVDTQEVRESFFNSSLNLGASHFTWGAEIGSSLDMTGHDLSTFDADVILGYKNKFLKIVGIGCGIHRSIRSGNNFIPLYGVIRTSFRDRPSLLFLNVQAGYSFNTISDYGTSGDFTAAVGLGINLQQSRACKTYVLLSMAYQYFSEANKLKIAEIDTNYIYYARLGLGINF